MSMRAIITSVSLAAVLITTAATAKAAPQKARRSYDMAVKLAKDGNAAQSLLILNRMADSLSAVRKSRPDSALLSDIYKLNAQNYQRLGDSDKALRLYQEALALARALGDKRSCATLCGNISTIYYSARQYANAQELLTSALKLNTEMGDTVSMRNNMNNFGLIAYNQARYQEALQYMAKAFALTPKGDRLGRSIIMTNRAEVYRSQQLYGKAEAELARALALQRGLKFDTQMLQTQLNMALVKAKTGKRNAAKSLVADIKGKLHLASPSVRSNAYRQLVDISFALGDSIEGLHNILRYEELGDSVWSDNRDAQLRQLLVAYDAERLRHNNDTLEASVDAYRTIVKQRTIIISVVIIFVIALTTLVIALWLRMKSDRKKNELINSQRDRLLAYEQQEHERKQREMTHQLDSKTRQLTTYTIDLAAINDFHQKMGAELCALCDEMGVDMNSDKARLKDIIVTLRHYNDKPVGEDFRVYFDEVHPDFLNNLSKLYPKLSKTDLRLCAYLLLGMSTKEISALTYREVRSVESSRYRLRKKLGVDADTDLRDFLMKLQH